MELAGLNVLDVFIALFVVVVILRGARTGFLAGVFSLVGVVVGVSAGSRVAPSGASPCSAGLQDPAGPGRTNTLRSPHAGRRRSGAAASDPRPRTRGVSPRK